MDDIEVVVTKDKLNKLKKTVITRRRVIEPTSTSNKSTAGAKSRRSSGGAKDDSVVIEVEVEEVTEPQSGAESDDTEPEVVSVSRSSSKQQQQQQQQQRRVENNVYDDDDDDDDDVSEDGSSDEDDETGSESETNSTATSNSNERSDSAYLKSGSEVLSTESFASSNLKGFSKQEKAASTKSAQPKDPDAAKSLVGAESKAVKLLNKSNGIDNYNKLMESSRIETKKPVVVPADDDDDDEESTEESDEETEDDDDDDDVSDGGAGKDKSSKSLNSTLTTGGTNSPAADSGIGTSASGSGKGSLGRSEPVAPEPASAKKSTGVKEANNEVNDDDDDDDDSADYYYAYYDKALNPKKKETRKVKSSMSVQEAAKQVSTGSKESKPSTKKTATPPTTSQVAPAPQEPRAVSPAAPTPVDLSPTSNSNELAIKKKINEFNLLRKNLKNSQTSNMMASLGSSSSAKKRLPPLSRQKTELASAGTIRSSYFASASNATLDTLGAGSRDYYPVGSAMGTSMVSAVTSAVAASSVNFKSLITVDTSKARSNSEVLRMCISQLGWTECPFPSSTQTSTCDIIWQSCTTHEGDLNSVIYYNQTSRVNKFPNMNYLLRKGPLTLSLNVQRSIFKNQFDFYPRTWFLPEQFNEFSTDCRYIHEKQSKAKEKLTAFIVKPNDGSQGEGIYLIKDPEDYLKTIPKTKAPASSGHYPMSSAVSKSYIVQEYIHNPFLIDGLKSDLRIYVVVTSLKPLEIYICDEGLVRFATVNYQEPSEENLKQIYMHLTNYSLNKKNEAYRFTAGGKNSPTSSTSSADKQQQQQQQQLRGSCNQDDAKSAGNGSKRKLSRVFKYMSSKGYQVNKIKMAIDDLVIKTVFSLLPEMKVECAFETFNSANRTRPSCFQIIGFDILLTDALKPVLLEVNCNPSLRVDYEVETKDGRVKSLPSPIDIEIKKPLVLETLKLIAPKKKIELIEKCKKEEQQQEKAAKARTNIVHQRIEERMSFAQKPKPKFDIDKCPLLSKPGELYKRKLRLGANASNVNYPVFQTRSSSSQSTVHPSSTSSSSSAVESSSTKTAVVVDEEAELKTSPENVNTKSTSQDEAAAAAAQDEQAPSCLRNIYPSTRFKSNYSHLFITEHIADIFIYFTLSSGVKYMSHHDFRHFVKKCNLVNDKFSADNLDIIFFDLNKKWELYNRKKNDYTEGLCYQGFVEFFMTLARMNFNESSMEQSLKSMIYYCKFFLKDDPGSSTASAAQAKLSQYCDIDPNDELLKPMSAKLLTELNRVIKLKILEYSPAPPPPQPTQSSQPAQVKQATAGSGGSKSDEPEPIDPNDKNNYNKHMLLDLTSYKSQQNSQQHQTLLNKAFSRFGSHGKLNQAGHHQAGGSGGDAIDIYNSSSMIKKKSRKSLFPIFFDTN